MSQKKLRKELTVSLLKGIEEVLNKHNPEISTKIRKTTLDVSKTVAKKFVKALKELPEKAIASKTAKKLSEPAKNFRITDNKTVSVAPKKKIVPLKSKVKK